MDTAILRQHFSALFQGAPRLLSRAPGRVNLIGEHTDYNDGFVCPMAIDRDTTIVAAPRSDRVVRIHSLLANETVEFPIDRPVPHDGPAWSLYPKGAAEAMRQRISLTHGMDALVHSTVPLGGGLSSSASFEVATAIALLAINDESLPLDQVALACQWAEHNYPRMPCGIMDQFISAMAQKGHALLLDCRDQSTRQVPLDDANLRVVISNSNVKHELVAGEYATRRQQCQEAVEHLRQKSPLLASLRDATLPMLESTRATMDPTLFRRTRHVITEIQRTLDFAAALEKRDYQTCGRLMYASHASLRDDFEVSTPELDALVEISRSADPLDAIFGARMTGGGFGGSIVALCTRDAVAPLTAAIASEYPKKSKGIIATTFPTLPSAGASVELL